MKFFVQMLTISSKIHIWKNSYVLLQQISCR